MKEPATEKTIRLTSSHVKLKKTKLAQALAAACLLFFLAAPSDAGTVSIYNADDSGTGSLRWALEITNAAGGSNTINWIYGSGGTLTLLSDLPAINGSTTLDVTNSITDAAIADSTNTMSLAGAVTVHNDSLSSTFTIHEDIGGAGSLSKTGDGVLILTGDNTYSGGTSVSGGTLAIDADASLGSSGTGLSLDGGTLKILDDVSSSRAITLGTGGGFFDTNTYSLDLSGQISGSGGLSKNGSGLLTLYYANTYLGTTTINAGTLALGTDNAIPVTSTVTLASGAVLDMQSRTQSLSSVSSAGEIRLRLQSGVTNLDVAGTADIAGSSLRVTYSPQIITAGQTFTPITASLLSGQFDSLYSPAAVSFTPAYYSTGVVLTASLVPFYGIADTDNRRAVGTALEPLRTAPAGDIATVLANLYTLETEALISALDQIGPVSLTSIRGLSLASADMRASALRARTEDLTSGTLRESFTTYSGDKERLPDIEFTEAPRGGGWSSVRRTRSGSPLSFFAAASAVSAKAMQEKDGGDNPAYDLSGSGVYAGADYVLSGHLVIGLLAGVNKQKAGVYYPSEAEITADASHYGAYASFSAGDLLLRFYAGRTRNSYETSRDIVFSGISRTAEGTTSGTEENLEAGMEYRLPGGTPAGGVVPYLTLSSDRLRIEPFTENGAGDLDLSVGQANARSLRSAAGIRYFEAVENGESVVTMSLSGAWEREFEDSGLALTSSLAAGGQAFTVAPDLQARNYFTGSARVGLEQGSLSYYLEYSGEFRKRYYSHLGSLGASFRF